MNSSVFDLVRRAVSATLAEHPAVNATFEDARSVRGAQCRYWRRYRGRVGDPVLRRLDSKSLAELATERRRLTERVQEESTRCVIFAVARSPSQIPASLALTRSRRLVPRRRLRFSASTAWRSASAHSVGLTVSRSKSVARRPEFRSPPRRRCRRGSISRDVCGARGKLGSIRAWGLPIGWSCSFERSWDDPK